MNVYLNDIQVGTVKKFYFRREHHGQHSYFSSLQRLDVDKERKEITVSTYYRSLFDVDRFTGEAMITINLRHPVIIELMSRQPFIYISILNGKEVSDVGNVETELR